MRSLAALGCAMGLAALACMDGSRYRSFQPPPTPPALGRGEALFETHCAHCHGHYAAGTDSGPPLIHPMYGPAHHADEAFTLAVRQGVMAHHWRFGNMPPQPQVSDSALADIRDYVRWLQQEAGVH